MSVSVYTLNLLRFIASPFNVFLFYYWPRIRNEWVLKGKCTRLSIKNSYWYNELLEVLTSVSKQNKEYYIFIFIDFFLFLSPDLKSNILFIQYIDITNWNLKDHCTFPIDQLKNVPYYKFCQSWLQIFPLEKAFHWILMKK